ncbi:hypothetical protein LTR78_000731 [Recurvomyces mirabilis]|uniref:Uncharacterized protein n=1 Tax=Recurvomyces mirabilis TaxID=574656 RepID=A0AAE0WX24_9PEZI|nr:hypothetical protein LTR78_000731 [Recurvomyces mirabilis]KAK5158701.1 hypothetical protein LTS14_002809 [Recurvomyces mirabilis]
MASAEKVTVDRAYFDALLRRADFHTNAQIYGCSDPVNVSISKDEYDSLLRTSREFEALKSALFQGGITPETLQLLISNSANGEHRKDSGVPADSWADDYDHAYAGGQQQGIPGHYHDVSWRQAHDSTPGFNLAPGTGPYGNGNGPQYHQQGNLKVPAFSRQIDFGAPPSSVPDDAAFDDNASLPDEATQLQNDYDTVQPTQERRTLYFAGLSERTTYKELLSVVKGGKLLSVNLGPNRSGTVTYSNGASDFLAWAKRNDVYIHNKRVEVRWADRQYRLNGHIANKLGNGATRNILIRNAVSIGLDKTTIRLDMEHIHNLVIVDVNFRNGDAYVSTNSVHNALFARTCMMSRTTYKGCKIEFYRDECDVPLPLSLHKARAAPREPVQKKKAPIMNRFDLLNLDDNERSSDEENRPPMDGSSEDDETADMTSNLGVSLKFLDTESSA